MARTEQLSHSDLYLIPGEREAAGQIVGTGNRIWLVVRAFMASPDHRDAILGDWTEIGLGHIHSDSGVWVTVWFRK